MQHIVAKTLLQSQNIDITLHKRATHPTTQLIKEYPATIGKERVNGDVGNISKAESYRQANKEGKQGGNESSSTAKARAMNELYEELETPECERKISRIAKAKDVTKNNQIKEEHSVLLRDLDKILGRW